MTSQNKKFSNPEVFLSYSTVDAILAKEVRDYLEQKDIHVWQDVTHMSAGIFLHTQIAEAIAQVNHLVVLITPNSLGSDWVRDEMRLARRKKICILPIIGDDNIKPDDLLPFLRKRLCILWNQNNDKDRITTRLRETCQAVRYAYMAPTLSERFVPRGEEFNALKTALLGTDGSPVAISTVLVGTGGFGKTWLATALCDDDEIRDRYSDDILWITLGEKPSRPELLHKLGELIRSLGEKETPIGFDEARSKLSELLEKNRDTLLVIDDVWRLEDLEPFLEGGQGTVRRLITSRNRNALPDSARLVNVDAMKPKEAEAVLSANLPKDQADQCMDALCNLARIFGYWPLLLSLANGFLKERVVKCGEQLSKAITDARIYWEESGPTAYDMDSDAGRKRAVGICVGLSMNQLIEQQKNLFLDLAIFPEDIEIPIETIEQLWDARQAIPKHRTRTLLARMYSLSLLQIVDLGRNVIKLHDVIRTHLRTLHGKELPEVQQVFLNYFHISRWAELPLEEKYLWHYLQWHLEDGGRGADWLTALRDLRFLAVKSLALGSGAMSVSDLVTAVEKFPDDDQLLLMLRRFRPLIHLVEACTTPTDAMNCLSAYLPEGLVDAGDLSPPRLIPLHLLPDTPNQPLFAIFSGHKSYVSGCAFSQDSQFVLSASYDNTLRIWSVKTGEIYQILEGHSSWVTACAFSHSGEYVLSSSHDNTLRVWSVKTGETIQTLKGHKSAVWDCAFSPHGDRLLSASGDHTLRIWSLETGNTLKTLTGHSDDVRGCAFSHDGQFVVSASLDGTLRIWSATTGKRLRTLKGHSSLVAKCSFSQDDRFILSAAHDKTLIIWMTATGKALKTLKGHSGSVLACAFHPKNPLILSASFDHTIKIWSMETGQPILTLDGHSDWVEGCTFSPDGKYVLSASRDKTLRLWSIESGAVSPSKGACVDNAHRCLFHPSGKHVFSTSWTGTLRIWSVDQEQVCLVFENHVNHIKSTISQDGRLVLSSSLDNFQIWSFENGQSVWKMKIPSDCSWECSLSPDGQRVLSGSVDGMLRIWSVNKAHPPLIWEGHTAKIAACTFSKNGQLVLSASEDNTLRIWSAENGQTLHILNEHSGAVNGCAFSPDGNRVLSASDDGTLRIWSTTNGKTLKILKGHMSAVRGCTFSPCGRRVLSASRDGTLRIWDALTGQCQHVFPVLNAPLHDCAFSPNGQLVVACGKGGIYFLKLVE
ncbi:TIR domain-containing protein [Candidatus Magnetobacterium casense]|uniref:TIR domain-containing protein n=1 Tax=Candidatus Magnetobacterium casense TaxID=1455061 RepID=A0ABS6RZS2_9BACT|nr:TIR domain-containing protein [Candidatus Magnetobacterium casensis]MBV6342109.1 TIR domain-containing protein [Candidatus Magnetobacterium casensis]